MQAIGGMVIDGGIVFATPPIPGPTGPISGDATVNLGTTVNWSSNTWLYLAEGQANVRSASFDTVNYDTNNMVWQLFYAHRSIRLPVSSGPVSATGGGARYSSITRQGGSNSPMLYGAIAGSGATLTDFKNNTDTVISSVVSISYTANTLWQGNVTTQFTVPANRFFMLGFLGGPYYRNYKRAANNYTAVNSGNAIVTVINQAYTAGWPSGPGRGIPTQIGGNVASYMSLASNILLAAVKFEIV